MNVDKAQQTIIMQVSDSIGFCQSSGLTCKTGWEIMIPDVRSIAHYVIKIVFVKGPIWPSPGAKPNEGK